jgi:hypothetical protein
MRIRGMDVCWVMRPITFEATLPCAPRTISVTFACAIFNLAQVVIRVTMAQPQSYTDDFADIFELVLYVLRQEIVHFTRAIGTSLIMMHSYYFYSLKGFPKLKCRFGSHKIAMAGAADANWCSLMRNLGMTVVDPLKKAYSYDAYS